MWQSYLNRPTLSGGTGKIANRPRTLLSRIVYQMCMELQPHYPIMKGINDTFLSFNGEVDCWWYVCKQAWYQWWVYGPLLNISWHPIIVLPDRRSSRRRLWHPHHTLPSTDGHCTCAATSCSCTCCPYSAPCSRCSGAGGRALGVLWRCVIAIIWESCKKMIIIFTLCTSQKSKVGCHCLSVV